MTFDDGVALCRQVVMDFQARLRSKAGGDGNVSAVIEFLNGITENIDLLSEAKKIEAPITPSATRESAAFHVSAMRAALQEIVDEHEAYVERRGNASEISHRMREMAEQALRESHEARSNVELPKSRLLQAVRDWVYARSYGDPVALLTAEYNLNERFREAVGLDTEPLAPTESNAKVKP